MTQTDISSVQLLPAICFKIGNVTLDEANRTAEKIVWDQECQVVFEYFKIMLILFTVIKNRIAF